MTSKVLLLFLGTFLLVQSSFGKAIPLVEESTEQAIVTTLKPETWDAEESTEIEISDDISPGDKIFFYILSELSKVAADELRYGKILLKDVIVDISALDDKDEEISARLEEYSEFVVRIEQLENTDDTEDIDVLELLVDFNNLLDESNVTLIENPNSNDKLFAESLEKNGLEILDQQVEQKFEEIFSKDFYAAFNEILNSATIEEWPEKTKFEDWLQRFIMENDLQAKMILFEEIFDLL